MHRTLYDSTTAAASKAKPSAVVWLCSSVLCLVLAAGMSVGMVGCSSGDALNTTVGSSASEEDASTSSSSAETSSVDAGDQAAETEDVVAESAGEVEESIALEPVAESGGDQVTETAADQGTSSAPSYVYISCSVRSDAADGSVSASASASLPEGSTAIDALAVTGLSYRARSSQYGTYIAAIGGLAEKDSRFGSGCGWLYSVNGTTPGRSADSYTLNDGDSVSWFFTRG